MLRHYKYKLKTTVEKPRGLYKAEPFVDASTLKRTAKVIKGKEPKGINRRKMKRRSKVIMKKGLK